MKFSDVAFLTVAEVERLQVAGHVKFGGSAGIRDRGLLESAVTAPQASFGGAPLHATLATMAATLAYGIAKNHPFVDGNKRAALLASRSYPARRHAPNPYHSSPSSSCPLQRRSGNGSPVRHDFR